MATQFEQKLQELAQLGDEDKFRQGIFQFRNDLTTQFGDVLKNLRDKGKFITELQKAGQGGTVDVGQGYTLRNAGQTDFNQSGQAFNKIDLLDPQGNLLSTVNNTNSSSTRNKLLGAFTEAQGLPPQIGQQGLGARQLADFFAQQVGDLNLATSRSLRGDPEPVLGQQPDTRFQLAGGQAQSDTGFVDPATGQPTPVGVGEPVEEFNKRQGTKTRFTLGTGEELEGLIPNYKGIFPDDAESNANSSAINELFKAYHNRSANAEEISFWSGKRVGDLEDTLARTEIFGEADADKIRAQMTANGQTHIRNQFELQQLAQAGQVSPETLNNIGSVGTGMIFRPTPSSNEAVQSTATVAEASNTATSSTQQVLDELKTFVEDQAAKGKIINPGVDISPEMIEGFLTQAKAELGPFFDQKFQQSQQDINIAMQRIVEDFDIQKRAIDKQFAAQQEQSREGFARRGLAFSSSRQRQEKELADAAKEKLDANKLQATRDAQDLGIRGERVVGSEFLPDTPEIQVGERAIVAQAGQFGLGAPRREEELFTGTPDTFGTLQQDRLFGEQARAGELEANERSLRGEFAPNPEEFGTGDSFIGSERFNTRV